MGMIQKLFVVLLCMNLFLFIFAPAIGTSAENTLLSKFFNLESESISMDNTDVSGTMQNIDLVEDSAIVGASTLSIVSVFKMVWNFVKAILGILFAPLILVNSIAGAPYLVKLLFAVPNIVILLFGTVSFIKGYDW